MTEQKIFAHLAVHDGQAAVAFYKKAFGATELMVMPAEDGKRLMHADLSVNGQRFFLHDDFPEHRSQFSKAAWSPKITGGTSVTVHMIVVDCDATHKRAVDAGAESIMAPADMFWGDRYAQVIDPFGHVWSFGQPLKKADAMADHAVHMTRTLNAPRALAFKAWTDPAMVKEWWGPKYFTNPVCEVDARPGGAIRIVMRGPDGTDYPMAGRFDELSPPDRLTFTSWVDVNGERVLEVQTTVTFEDKDGKTLLTMWGVVQKATDAARPMLAGMEQGWSGSLDKLVGFINGQV